MKRLFLLGYMVLMMPFVFATSGVVNIKEAGADSKGQQDCSKLIAESVDKLFAEGGGELYFPAGVYLTGPIELKSNITLNISEGAILKFTDDFDDYLPMIESRWEGVRVKTFKSPIYAHNATNITIKGRGLIDGSGRKWWDFWWPLKRGEDSTNSKWEQLFKENNKDLIEKNAYIREKIGNFLRPPMIMPYACNNVRIQDVTMINPPFWTIMPAFSENITIDGITILNPDDSPNTDGIDPSSCRNVRISNCHISVGDDCIVIKSGRDDDGREANVPTENITITNCTMLDGHGGVVIGSEMSGSVRRVTISNCVFQGTDRGIRIKTMRGRGGVVEDVRVSNIVMYDIVKQGVMLNMHYHPTPEEPVSERTPAIRNIFLSNIRINKAKQAIAIRGLNERYAENINFTDFNVSSEKGIEGKFASNVKFRDFTINVEKGHAFEFSKSYNLQFTGISVEELSKDKSAILLNECSGVLVNNSFQVKPISHFVSVDEACDGIYIINNVLPGATKNVLGKCKGLINKNNL